MNILTDKKAFIVSNMMLEENEYSSNVWSVHDTFHASGIEVLTMTAFSYDDKDCRFDFTINREIAHKNSRTPSLGEIKKLLDEALNKIPKHILNY